MEKKASLRPGEAFFSGSSRKILFLRLCENSAMQRGIFVVY